MRVFYLHLFLFIWVSTALIGQVQRGTAPAGVAGERWIHWLWSVGALGMVGGLFGLGLAPDWGIPIGWWLHVAAWASLAVAVAGTSLWVAGMRAAARTPSLSVATSLRSPYS